MHLLEIIKVSQLFIFRKIHDILHSIKKAEWVFGETIWGVSLTMTKTVIIYALSM